MIVSGLNIFIKRENNRSGFEKVFTKTFYHFETNINFTNIFSFLFYLKNLRKPKILKALPVLTGKSNKKCLYLSVRI